MHEIMRAYGDKQVHAKRGEGIIIIIKKTVFFIDRV